MIKNLEDFFHQADKDNSGTLTISELAKALKAQGYKGSKNEIAVSVNCGSQFTNSDN